MRHPGPQQHRRQTHGTAHDAEAVRRRDGDRVPQPQPRPEKGMPGSGHHHRRHRPTEFRDGRHGERRRHGDRRGHYPCTGRDKEKRFPPERRREIRRSGSQMLLHYPRARRRRPHDHLYADEEHPFCGEKRILSVECLANSDKKRTFASL